MKTNSSSRFLKLWLSGHILALFLCVSVCGVQAQTPAKQKINGLVLNSPIQLVAASKPVLPQNEQSPIKSQATYSGKSGGLEINVTRMEFKDGIDINLEGAVNGANEGISKLPGVSDPRHSTKDVTVSGAAAKRDSYSAKRYNGTIAVESLYIRKGQTVWMIQTNFAGNNAAARAMTDSLLNSAALE